MADLAAAFRRPFREQIAAYRLRTRTLVPTATWRDIWKDQHDRAFVVAGAMKADLLADLADAADKAVAQGTSLEEFRRDFRATVERRGWHGWTGEGTKAGEAWRTRVIYRTNMRTSYMAGRHAQLRDGNFRFWIYRHGGAVEPRLHHLSWDGVALPPDHPFWAKHFPPNGWGCSCYVTGARSARGVRRLGGDPDKALPDGWNSIDAKTGEPRGIGKGWGYSPGRSTAEEIRDLVNAKAKDLPDALGAALRADAPPPPPAADDSLFAAVQDLLSARPLPGDAADRLEAIIEQENVSPELAAMLRDALQKETGR